MKEKVYTQKEWDKDIKKKRKDEFEYFLFSIRMIAYGLGSVFLVLLFLVKLKMVLRWYHYVTIMLFVLSIVFIDKTIKFISKEDF